MAGSTGTAREEAERLVATVLAMAAQSGLGAAVRGRDSSGTGGLGDVINGVVGQFLGGSGQQHRGSGWATGSAECCVCPVCKAIAATRDPSPERAERLAAGAGDLATGVASVLRGLAKVASATTAPPRPQRPQRPAPTPDQAWSAATREPHPTAAAGPSDDPWTAATRTPAPERTPPAPATAPATEKAEKAPAPAAGKAEKAPAPADDDVVPSAGGDPWAAATRAPRRARTAPAGTPERPGVAAEGAGSALPEMPGSAGVAGDRPGARIEKSGSVFPGEGDAVGVDHDGPAGA